MMYKTVKLAKDHGVGVGAHPGYPDLVGFGRRNMDCTPEEVRDYVAYQVGALKAFCALHGVPLQHVKPHGSLYNMSVGNEPLIRAIVEAIAASTRTSSTWPSAGPRRRSSRRSRRRRASGLPSRPSPTGPTRRRESLPREAFPAPSSRTRKVAAERALRMAKEGKIITTDGSVLAMQIDTICVHGDNPSAVELVDRYPHAIEAEGYPGCADGDVHLVTGEVWTGTGHSQSQQPTANLQFPGYLNLIRCRP